MTQLFFSPKIAIAMVKMKTGPWALELITGSFRADSIQAMVLAAHIFGPVATNPLR